MLIGIIMIPMYVSYMGPEAYGLVGFFTMLQAWFLLLDIGLSPTMARETASYCGDATNSLDLRRLLRALECIFFFVALLGGTFMILFSESIANYWLKVEELSISEVKNAIMLMSIIVALRLVCGLYRGAINGFERLVWLSSFNIIIATARFIFVIPFFIFFGTSPTEFFGYQLTVAILEITILIYKTYRLMPRLVEGKNTPWQLKPLRRILKFSLSIAFTSSIWVLVTQTDKLILSKLLSLSDFAYFSLSVLAASGVLLISTPISGALLPRLTKLSAEGNLSELFNLYRNSTQLIGVVAIPTALVMSFFPEKVLWAWTGDAEIILNAPVVLSLYALGNGILALGAFPYYLQYARGDLKLHLIGSSIFLVILIPALIWCTTKYGISGAGYAWVGTNAFYFFFWVPTVHRHFKKGLHHEWLIKDLSAILALSLFAAMVVRIFVKWPQGRIPMTFTIIAVSFAILIFAIMGSSFVRTAILNKLQSHLGVST